MFKIKVLAGLVLSAGCVGRICSSPLSLLWEYLSSPCVSLYGFPSVNARVQISPNKDINQTGLWASLMAQQ